MCIMFCFDSIFKLSNDSLDFVSIKFLWRKKLKVLANEGNETVRLGEKVPAKSM